MKGGASRFERARHHLERMERAPAASAMDIAAVRGMLGDVHAEDYLDCLAWSDGVEGYVGGRDYLWLWSAVDVRRLNDAYHVQELAPGLVLFGSDAAALGYGYDVVDVACPVVSIELAAMHREYLRRMAGDFTEFIEVLASSNLDSGEVARSDHRPPDWLRGHVIHEKHPIVLGGDPADPDNRVLVPREEHPGLAYFFARTLHEVRRVNRGE